MSNGEEYLLEEFDKEIATREALKPDFSKCGVGADFAECQHNGTTLLLKDARIRQRQEVEKAKKGILIGGAKVGGWGSVVGAIAYVFAKVHGWLPEG